MGGQPVSHFGFLQKSTTVKLLRLCVSNLKASNVLHSQKSLFDFEQYEEKVHSLGRGGCNRSRDNPGIAKKGGGGSDPCQDFFGVFDIVN